MNCSISTLQYELNKLQTLANIQAENGKMTKLVDKVQDVKPCNIQQAEEAINICAKEFIKAIENSCADTPARRDAINAIKRCE